LIFRQKRLHIETEKKGEASPSLIRNKNQHYEEKENLARQFLADRKQPTFKIFKT